MSWKKRSFRFTNTRVVLDTAYTGSGDPHDPIAPAVIAEFHPGGILQLEYDTEARKDCVTLGPREQTTLAWLLLPRIIKLIK